MRDVQENRTYQITSSGQAFAPGFNNAGTLLSYVTVTPTGLGSTYVLDLQTGDSHLVSRASGASGAAATGAHGMISGDGRAVVFVARDVPGSGAGIYHRDLTSNVTTRVGDVPADGSTDTPGFVLSVSDNGQVATIGSRGATEQGLIVTASSRTTVAGAPLVSGDGKTAAYVRTDAATPRLTVRSVATGAESTVDGPARSTPTSNTKGRVAWVSPDGARVAVAPVSPALSILEGPVGFHAQLLDRGTGDWSPAGTVADALGAPEPMPLLVGASAVSRNGDYSVIRAGGGGGEQVSDPSNPQGFPTNPVLAVANNVGGGLPGGVDHPPAVAYFGLFTGSSVCSTPSQLKVFVNLAPRFLGHATKVTGKVFFDGVQVGADTYTQNGVATIPVSGTLGTVTVRATVTFADGTSTTGSYDYPPAFGC